MNHGQLSKIERGVRPYTQDFLERVAEELNCDPADILVRNPLDKEAVWSIWDRIDPPNRETALRILEQLAAPAKDKKSA